MKLQTHLDLADQWDTAMDKLNMQDDHIAVIEICMMMGTTLMNAVFHKRGITEEAYDQNHSDKPTLTPEMEAALTPDVQEMMEHLAYIEAMRKLHTRGLHPDREERILPPWEPEVVDRCVANIRKMQAFANKECGRL